jgi:hypothetical protein
MIRIALPGLMVILVVAGLVGTATWNRSSPPRQMLVLTEHELSLPSDSGGEDDHGLQLRIEIERRYDPLDARNWLSEDRLRALGFSLDVPAGAPEAQDAYNNVPPRVGWLVLEYGGTAFQEIERRRAMKREAQQWREAYPTTRLVPVDAGPDFDTLRAKYASGHLILRAIFGLSYIGPSDSGPFRGPLLYGLVREIVPGNVTVPRRFRPVIAGLALPSALPDGSPRPPRYEAELATGPLGVAYLRGLRRLEQDGAGR